MPLSEELKIEACYYTKCRWKELPISYKARVGEVKLRKFRDGFDAVILGHSHRHLLETAAVNGAPRTMVLLGDWVRHYSYLCYEDGNFALSSFLLPKKRREM